MKLPNRIGAWPILPALASLALVNACQTVGETGRSQFLIYPEATMAQMGVAAYEEETSKYPIVRTGPDAAMVQRIGERIANASGRNYDWEFRLLDAPGIANAFCLPGGKVAIYTGILPITQSEDALAAVVGHEVAHATAHHGNERMSQSVVAQIGLVGADFAMNQWGDLSSQTRTEVMGLLGVGTQVGVLLPFSRTHESEADEIGLRFLIRAGYDPNQAPEFWMRMAALSDGARDPEWLSTHPDPIKRAARLRELIPQLLREEQGN